MSAALTLALAPGLDLPIEAVTETFGILAKRGAGKSNAAVVMAEQMYAAGLPWVAIDPKGDWWGIRSSADGKGAGLPVLVLGGLHGDVPLEPTAGRVVADLLVTNRLTAVVDVSLMSKADMRRFLADLAERLYATNTEPLHVFAEEAHEYIPQRVAAGDARMVGAWEKLVKWGRTHGLGVTLITQRSASLNKDVLTQVETLIALRTTGPQDQAAIRAWVDEHESGQAMISQLRKLTNGSAFVLSPQWLELDEPQRVEFYRRRTFDSGATPKAGQVRTVPRKLAEVDLDALQEAMAETIERAKAEDPKALRRLLADANTEVERLRAQVAKGASVDLAKVRAETIEVQQRLAADEISRAVQDALSKVEVEPTPISQIKAAMADAAQDAQSWVAALNDRFHEIDDLLAQVKVRVPDLPRVRVIADKVPPVTREMLGAPGAEPRPEGEARPGSGSQSGGHRGRAHAQPFNLEAAVTLSKAERTILEALAKQDRRLGTRQVAFLARYSHKSGGFRNALSSLRTSGYIEGRGDVKITDEGLAVFGDFEPIPTGGRALLEWWKIETPLGKAEQNILDVLYGADGAEVDKADIAEATGYSASSGGFRNAMSRLRSLELAHGRNGLALSETLLGP